MPGWGEKPKSFRLNVLSQQKQPGQCHRTPWTSERCHPHSTEIRKRFSLPSGQQLPVAELPGSPPAARLHTCSRARMSCAEQPGPHGLPAVPAHTDRPPPTASEPARGDTGDTCPPPPCVRVSPCECVRACVMCGVHQVPRHCGWGRIPEGRTNLVLRFPPRSHSILGVPVVFTSQRCPSPLSLHLW